MPEEQGSQVDKAAAEPAEKTIDIHYEKSNLFRVIPVEGAYGGLTPHGKILMSVYTERWPLPKVVTQEHDGSGRLGKEVNRISREGVYREVETALLMDIDTARAIKAWLEDKIDRIEKLSGEKE
jgi:hypothetical protein